MINTLNAYSLTTLPYQHKHWAKLSKMPLVVHLLEAPYASRIEDEPSVILITYPIKVQSCK